MRRPCSSRLFTLGSTDFPFLRVDVFVGIVAPLLGIAFGFDAVNRERAERTLPVSSPSRSTATT